MHYADTSMGQCFWFRTGSMCRNFPHYAVHSGNPWSTYCLPYLHCEWRWPLRQVQPSITMSRSSYLNWSGHYKKNNQIVIRNICDWIQSLAAFILCLVTIIKEEKNQIIGIIANDQLIASNIHSVFVCISWDSFGVISRE